MRFLLLFLLMFPALLKAQAVRDEKLVKRWSKISMKEDSNFIVKNSIFPYRSFELNRSNPGEMMSDWIDSAIFAAPVNTVLGPFGKSDTLVYLRIMEADSSLQLHLSGITLQRNGLDSAAVAKDFEPFEQLFLRNENIDSLCLSAKSVYGENINCDDITCYDTELQPDLREELAWLSVGQNKIIRSKNYIHLFRTSEPPVKARTHCRFSVLAVANKKK